MINFKNKILKLFNLEVCCNHNFKRDSQIKIVTCTKCNKEYWYDLTDTTIKKIKDTYSREEVIVLLNAYGNHIANEFSDCDCSDATPFSMTEEDWIKENL